MKKLKVTKSYEKATKWVQSY